MTKVVGVRFKKMGKVYYFDPHGAVNWSRTGSSWSRPQGGDRMRRGWSLRKSTIDDEKITSAAEKGDPSGDAATDEDTHCAEQNERKKTRSASNMRRKDRVTHISWR